MRVDIFSDVVCPWCYVGKRRFEQALAGFANAEQVKVTWHSFELDPAAESDPAGAAPALGHAERLAAKFGRSLDEVHAMDSQLTALAAAEGLDYHLSDVRSANTFDAHRLIQYAGTLECQDALEERLFRATFTEGAALGDHATLQRLAVEAGLDPEAVAAVLAGDDFADAVRADEDQARQLGISGVPFFVIDSKYGVSGAQSAAVLEQALTQAWAERDPART